MTVGELSHRPADGGRSPRGAPVVVMAYTGSGADQLRPVLSAFPQLTCTAGTGILPLCHHAITAWRAVDNQADGGFSPLATASVRTLSAGLMTAILARDGGNRWCEFVVAPPPAAEAFALLYPQTQFLIVHRRADAVMRDIIDASPWGLAGAEFTPFVLVSPSSTAAALASFWVSHTAQLLEFEQGHRGSCLRIRMEDLRANPAQFLRDISNFLSLDGEHILPGPLQELSRKKLADAPLSGTPTGIPLSQIPAPLLAQVNELHRSLGYPPVTAAGR